MALCRPWLLLTAFACVVGAATPQLSRAGQLPSFEASVELVPITVTVEYSSGGHAEGLSAAQFRLLDDGAPRDIAVFDGSQVPVDLVLLLDTSSSMNARLPTMKSAARRVVESLRRTDRATIMSFGIRTTVVQPLTSDTTALVRALERLSCQGTTSLYDALYVALHEFSVRGADFRRRAIVVFSDGADTASLVGYDSLLDAARRRALATYTVRLLSPSEETDRFDRPARELAELARETGGRAFTAKGDEQVALAYESISRDLAHQYVLGFLPPPDSAPGVHRLTVAVNAPRVRVRARSAYIASERTVTSLNWDLSSFAGATRLYHPDVTSAELPTRLTIRTVLILGFGLTLGLWLFSGYYFTRRVNDLQRDSARVTQRYVRAQARMSAVRSQVLLASVYVRDALLDSNPESIVGYRLKLDEAFGIASRALSQYEPVVDAASESMRVEQLRARIEEFRRTVFDVLDGDSTRWHADALVLLRDQIMPKREQAVQVSEEVQDINRGSYIDQQAATAAIYRTTQQRIWTQFGLAVIASFFIGTVAIRRVAALEGALRRQHERDARTSDDLHRLSSQLLTAQEDERRAIARELHDEVGQALTAIKVELAVAERSMQAAQGPELQLGAARTLTESALQTVRDLSRLLHPAVLDDIGLAAAIEAYAREFRKRYDVAIEFTNDPLPIRLPAASEAATYRIVQEALTNVARHARASRCRVSLHATEDAVRVCIEDDGVGFDIEADRHEGKDPGLGLLGMRERVVRLGGTFQLESTRDVGTRVVATIPFPDVVGTIEHERHSGTAVGRFVGA